MDIDERKIGQWPNVAIEAGTPPAEAMERYGVEPGGKPPESDGEGDSGPDRPEDGKTPAEAASGPQESLERDTREKLRDDAMDWLKDHFACSTQLMGELDCWLDRQAAITEREVVEQREEQCAQLVNDMNAARQSLDATKRAIAKAGATWTEDADGSVAVVFAPDVERMQGVVKAQADAFKALERQLADTRDALESELRLHGPTEDKLHELLNALDESGITHIWHDDVGMWEVYTPEECRPDPDVDAIEDALVRFAWEFMEADGKLAEHRLVRTWAREIAGKA